MHTLETPVSDIHIAAPELHRFVRKLWQQAGSSETEAALVADHLVMSNLTGHDSHGVGMIPRYVRALNEGLLKLNRHAEIARDAGAVLTVEGGLGFGQVIAHEAMELGIARAKKIGICAVGLRNAHHIGRIGHWAEQCAAAGLVSFHFVNVAGFAQVAPFGGFGGRFGTNPFCAAFPRSGRPPLVLDFATSSIAVNKTRVAYNKGVPVPQDCLMDHEGRPTTDPKVMHEAPFGSLRTFGGHKGYGMAAMCEIFAGALTGGYTTHEETKVKGSAIVNCMLSVILDPQAFDAADAEVEADAFVEWVKASPRLAGHGEIYVPGEPERLRKAERSESGIPIDSTSWRQITEAALAVGMRPGEIESVVR
ncbi:malate/lactate/ureidoglycolate dehydrogenase [Noviherbaspirillum massiliense]|uniref:malate/lactate/ureidoglycolate dehydrogenase n=1 Tax=Noviherbaspirillum massiliense TaxID=1465823 RepID=UPI0002FC7C32|nr:malate/lactate/ureidoglycolate dehydrogenase [Noviherbaspirillum massiliense]